MSGAVVASTACSWGEVVRMVARPKVAVVSTLSLPEEAAGERLSKIDDGDEAINNVRV